MITRRRFLAQLAGAAAAAAVGPTVLAALPTPPPAFSSIAFVQCFDPLPVTRLDMLYGFAALEPSHACRVLGA